MKMPKILIVDDMQTNRLLLRTLLCKRHCTILEATNGQEALEIVLREQPDLILMDLMMPVLDGWEAIRCIRALAGDVSKVPIFAVTAASHAEAEKALALGCDQVVAKPIAPQVVWTLIQQTLAAQQQAKVP